MGNRCDSQTTYDGIILVGDCNNNSISNNICNSNGNDGIKIQDATCDRNVVTGNRATGNAGADFTDAGTETTVMGNDFT